MGLIPGIDLTILRGTDAPCSLPNRLSIEMIPGGTASRKDQSRDARRDAFVAAARKAFFSNGY
ncbi:MAG TPA: hypothetical protein VE567_08340, partial [Sphingomonas sp.]|nr:hypothetical protein [Sphingomonas sp.]